MLNDPTSPIHAAHEDWIDTVDSRDISDVFSDFVIDELELTTEKYKGIDKGMLDAFKQKLIDAVMDTPLDLTAAIGSSLDLCKTFDDYINNEPEDPF